MISSGINPVKKQFMTIAAILADSEPVAYGGEIVPLAMDDKEVFVISDLHMAAGLNANGNYDGTENFFADMSISRFLIHLQTKISPDKKGLLIINGDFVDFLRIRNVPKTAGEFQTWRNMLSDMGIMKSISALQSSVSKKELDYGLRTDDYKSIWKLDICRLGHASVFKCLATWLLHGNELVVVKGNHDLEWFWKNVRDYLRLLLAANISVMRATRIEDELVRIVLPQIRFVDDKLLIENRIYVEHGHRYENFTTVDGPAVLPNGTELNLPFGSFFNRYLINRIELAYPYIDDVRPRQKILPLLIRERFPLAVQMLFKYIPFTILIIPKKQYLYAFRYLLQFFWIILFPVLLTGLAVIETLHHPLHLPIASPKTSIIQQYVLPQLENLLFLTLSYFLGRLFSFFSLSSPSSLYPDAQVIFDAYAEVEFVTFGHTHDPEQKIEGGKKYYNTGTWIPVYELDAADVRLDKTYTFLQFYKDPSGQIGSHGLMRWNDEAGRSEGMELRDSI
jgi:UDP-2,3-diacylglucosamine pyrophosphatase LpxH